MQMVGVVAPDGRVDHLEIFRERGVDHGFARGGGVALGEVGLEPLLQLAGGPREHQVDQLALARGPRRLIADEITDHPGIVPARRQLLRGLAVDAGREGRRVHVRHAHDGAFHVLPAAQWVDVGLAQRGARRQGIVQRRPISRVEAPGAHAARGELRGCTLPVGTEALLQVGQVEGHGVAQRFHGGARGRDLRSGGNAGEHLRPVDDHRSRRIVAGPIHAGGPEAASLRVHEPPATGDFLDSEEPRGLAPGLAPAGAKPAVAAGPYFGLGDQHAVFLRPLALQRVEGSCLARPSGVNVLPEVIDERCGAIEHRVAHIGLRQADLANLDRGGLRGVTHGHVDRAHGFHRRVAAGFDVDPVARARLVDGGSQLVRISQPLPIEAQRNGRAHPHIGERVNALGYVAFIAHQPQLEALAGRGAEFDHQEAGVTPVGGQGGVEVGQGPADRRHIGCESRLLGRGIDRAGPGHRQRQQP